MSNDNMKTAQGSKLIDLSEICENRAWTASPGVSDNEPQRAAAMAGSSADKVLEHLKSSR